MDKFLKFRDEVLEPLKYRLAPFRTHLMVLGVAFGLGLIMGVMKASTAPAKRAVADGWTMPSWTAFKADPLKQQLAGPPIFTLDPLKKKATDVAAVPIWRFTGTVRKGNQQVALIEIDKGQHIRRIMAGDELPGGAKVTAVNSGELVFTDGTGERSLKLFTGEKPPSDLPNRRN